MIQIVGKEIFLQKDRPAGEDDYARTKEDDRKRQLEKDEQRQGYFLTPKRRDKEIQSTYFFVLLLFV